VTGGEAGVAKSAARKPKPKPKPKSLSEAEVSFLLAEFTTAWDMVLAIDNRRSVFARYYTVLFVGVVAVISSFFLRLSSVDLLVCVGATLMLAFTIVAGVTVRKILESERGANIRYRRKVNLIREMFLAESKNPNIRKYLSHKELGILLLSQEKLQPEGVGRTLKFIYRAILMQQIALGLIDVAIWLLWATDYRISGLPLDL
jgi:hypothetical protein